MALSFVVIFSFVKRVQISTLKDELRRVTAEALGKDEDHQAAQASALAAEKDVRYTTVLAVLICSFVVYMEGTAVAIAARLEAVS